MLPIFNKNSELMMQRMQEFPEGVSEKEVVDRVRFYGYLDYCQIADFIEGKTQTSVWDFMSAYVSLEIEKDPSY